MIDYGCLTRHLSKILKKYYDLDLPISDRNVHAGGPENTIGSELPAYKAVINSAILTCTKKGGRIESTACVSRRLANIHRVICEDNI